MDEQQVGQYVAYTFYRVDPAWRRLPETERTTHKEAWDAVLQAHAPRFEWLESYTLTGVRPETDFFHWKITDRYQDLIELGAALNATPLAGWLSTPYSYLATTKVSQYVDKQSKAKRMGRIRPRGAEYLVVYPFVKIRPWYALPREDRGRAMREHAEVGSQWVTITNHTTYSFGIDDQEFMTVFECEEPSDFMDLMMRLRETEASKYTERDTPIFVGTHCSHRTSLDLLDGTAATVKGAGA
jgi:chlorite dismutase